ncbi:MAG: hypothetical protein AB7V50_11020 [Vampirovibrionia bacterium]
MPAKDKIESYILQMELPYEELDDSLWIIYESEANTDQKLVVSYAENIVHFRLKVMDVPKDQKTQNNLFKDLLLLNATGLTHGAFALEEDVVVLIDSLQSENLDYNEFQASVEALFLGVIDTYDELAKYIEK